MTDEDDERWMLIGGRRWRRTDPSLPEDLVEALKSHLGRGRAGVRTARKLRDEAATSAARKRVNIAKHGLGERGPKWWDEPVPARLHRAHEAIEELDRLDES